MFATPDIWVWPVALIELLVGAMLLLSWKTRWAASGVVRIYVSHHVYLSYVLERSG